MISEYNLYFRDIQGIHGRKPEENEEIEVAYKEAMDALKLKPNERIDKYYACAESDEEMEDETIEIEDGDETANGEDVSQSKENGEDTVVDGDNEEEDDAEMGSTKRVMISVY